MTTVAAKKLKLAMATISKHCKAQKFKVETPGMCCSAGKVKLQPLKAPDILKHLLSDNSLEVQHGVLHDIIWKGAGHDACVHTKNSHDTL